jgi:glycosyltransferase involved in cell wall biosynthesis
VSVPSPSLWDFGSESDRRAVDCSVIVPVFNEKEHIASSVAAMARLRFDGELEFLLVDGGSTDGTREVLKRLARADRRIHLLDNPRRVIPAGLNVGLRNARGRWVARMDAHSEYPPDYLERGVQRLLAGGVRWVSGPQISQGRGSIGRAVTLALGTPLGRGGSGRWARTIGPFEGEYELDSGVFCGVWERDTLLEYGGWDERWPRNEDSELAARFQECGERLVCLPAMAARYRPREALDALWRQYLDNGEFRARTARWHRHTLRRSNLLPVGLVLTVGLAVASPRPVRTPARAAFLWYALVLIAAAGHAATIAEHKRDAVLVPAVLAVMHVGFGMGFVRGMRRHGLPLAALASAGGLRRLGDRLAPGADAVFAPSLHR